jgi:hypothetical protein
MESDELAVAGARYREAYAGYRDCAQHILQKLGNGLLPSADEVAEETRLTDALAGARHDLLGVMAKNWPRS